MAFKTFKLNETQFGELIRGHSTNLVDKVHNKVVAAVSFEGLTMEKMFEIIGYAMDAQDPEGALRTMDDLADGLRVMHGYSMAGDVLFQADTGREETEKVVVEADGRGGADVRLVRGNFPVEFTLLCGVDCESEEEAIEEAKRWLEVGVGYIIDEIGEA